MDTRDYINAITKKLTTKTTENLIYGDPVEAFGKSFIPVTKTVWKSRENSRLDETSEESGGEKVYAEPLGFLEVTKAGARFIPLRRMNRILLAIAAGFSAGFVIGFLFCKNDKS